MFTGIVEETGRVTAHEAVETGARLKVAASFAGELTLGESVAVNGCCLTVAELGDTDVAFDLLAETLRLTNLGDLKEGSLVNLERALQVGARLSGHFVQGHVDTCSEIVAFEKVGQDHRLEIQLPADFKRYLIYKGSICVDGMSLTAAEVTEESFTIWITPHTWKVTNLQQAAAGTRVNLEFDMLAKYLEALAVRPTGMG